MPVCGAQSARMRVGGELERELALLHDRVVVAERLPLLEAHGAALYLWPSSTSARSMLAATASGVAPVTSITRAPSSLRIQVSWRLA